MPVLFTNNASAPLAASISSSATTIVVTTGQGTLFPALSGSDYFYATLTNSSNQLEIVKVTARSSDTMTVVRGQEGTTARAYSAADKIEIRVTAAGLTNMAQLDKTQTFSVTPTFTSPLSVASGGTGVATSTGTGSVVLSNSPALVTPALGTPASGNLANCTFPTLNQNTTGTAAGLSSTLAVTSGGTGATTLTANSVLLGNGTSAIQAVAPGTSGNVLTSNGTTWQSVARPQPDVQTFTSTSTWTKPTGGQTMARIMVWGGGGGGGGSNPGSGGGYNEQTVPLSYLAATVTATIGAGGAGSAGGTGGNGGQSSFALTTSLNGVSSVAAGGGYGANAGSGSAQPYIFSGGDPTGLLNLSIYGGYAGGGGGGGGSAWGGSGGGTTVGGTAPGGGGGIGSGFTPGGSGAIGRIIVMCW